MKKERKNVRLLIIVVMIFVEMLVFRLYLYDKDFFDVKFN